MSREYDGGSLNHLMNRSISKKSVEDSKMKSIFLWVSKQTTKMMSCAFFEDFLRCHCERWQPCSVSSSHDLWLAGTEPNKAILGVGFPFQVSNSILGTWNVGDCTCLYRSFKDCNVTKSTSNIIKSRRSTHLQEIFIFGCGYFHYTG